MSRKKTHEEYVAEVAAINPNIEVVGVYDGNKTKIIHRCKIDSYEWYTTPIAVLHGSGCPRCANNERYGHEEYIKKIAVINPDIEVVDKYINNCTKILHRCKIDGCEWYVRPNNILRGVGCPVCGKTSSANKLRKTHKQYIEEVDKVDPNIEVIGKYIDDCTKILHRCKFDGYEWMVKPNNILHGKGCPKCNLSKGEKNISAWLDEMHIAYEHQKTFNDCKDRYVLPFDFYLLDYNIVIEYNGLQHYEPVEHFGGKEKFEIQQRHDKIKDNYCKENNIRLFIISYFEDINVKLKELSDLIISKEVAA